MKKILMLFAAAALVLGAASCQKENFSQEITPGEEKIDYSDDPMGVIKVYIKKDDTKMGFEEKTGTDGKDHLYRSWEEGDVIDGCTPVTVGEKTTFKTFSYEVTDATTECITLQKKTGDKGVPSAAEGTEVHFVYAPGAVSFDETNGACSLDLSKQEEGAIPAVMVASGEVELTTEDQPKLDLTGEKRFKNIAAVIALKNEEITYKDLNLNPVTTVTQIKKASVNARAKGVLTLSGSGYSSLSEAKEADFSQMIIERGEVTTWENPIYVAALPGTGAISVTLLTNQGKFRWSTINTLPENGYARVKEKEYTQIAEAEISGTRYAIEDAFEYANNADGSTTIKLVEDCEPLDLLTAEKTITLDLNDHKVTQNGTYRLGVAEDGDLTIKDSGTNKTGSIIQSAPGSNTISMTNARSKLTIEGGKISSAENSTVATVYMTDGTLTMTGGEITGKRVGISMSSKEDANLIVSISDGKVTSNSSNAIAASAGNLNITGGYFKASAAVIYKSAGDKNNYKASGGYYNKALNEEYITIEEGYVCVSEPDDSRPDYDYVVKEASQAPDVVTVKVGTGEPKPFKTVADAVEEVNKDDNKGTECTITLIDDASVLSQEVIENTAGVILDLNDKTLTFNGSNRVSVGEGASLTIQDNGNDHKGTITQSVNNNTIVMSSSNSSLTIEGGLITCVESQTSATVYMTAGTLTMKGGKVTSKRNAISITNGALTVTGGEIEATGTGSVTSNAINLGEGSGNIAISGGYIHSQKATISITGSSQHKLELSNDCIIASESSYTVYSSSTVASPNNSTVTVTGGKYKSGNMAIFSTASGSTTKYSVKECKYNGPEISSTRLAPFYRNADNTDSDSEDYPRKVEYFVPVTLQIGSGEAQPYATVEEAVEEANNDANKTTACTITLNDNCTMGSSAKNVSNTAGVTLDLNGKTLTQNGSARLGVTTGGKLIIDDSSSDKSGAVTQSSGNAFAVTAGTLVINAGKISTSANNNAISISGGNVEINGDNVSITSPNVPSTSAATSVVRLGSGSLKLVKGTIGSSTNSGDNGNYTAVAVANGTFTMTGGYLYARRHAIIFSGTSGTGTATISGGRLETTVNGWLLVRFQANSINKLTVDGGGFFVKETNDYPGKLFYGKDKSTEIPTNAGVTINAGYFSQSPSGITRVTVNGTVSAKGSYTYDGKTYSYKVE